jgi:uncharacterized membrane protein
MSDLTHDDLSFLDRIGLDDRIQARAGADEPARTRPAFPRRTMIALLVLMIAMLIGAVAIIQTAVPYVRLASTKEFATVAGSSSSAGDELGLDDVNAVKTLYSAQWMMYAGIVIVFLLIAAIIAGVWWLRSRRWDDEHDEKDAMAGGGDRVAGDGGGIMRADGDDDEGTLDSDIG